MCRTRSIDSFFSSKLRNSGTLQLDRRKGLFGQGSQQIVLTLQETCGFFGANERPRNSSDASSEGDALAESWADSQETTAGWVFL